MSPPITVALLVCGDLSGRVYAEHGDYHAVFSRFLDASLPAPTQYTLDPYDVVTNQEYPSDAQLESYDAILLTGSAASAYENVEWINKLTSFVARVAEVKPGIKLIGICFGHQIIARALGGECVPNGGRWEVGPTPVQLTPLGQQLFATEELNIQEMHRDHVPALPPNFHLLGSTALSPNQGMVRFANPTNTPSERLRDIHIFTVQGHPEFTEPIVSGLVEQRAGSGVIDAEAAADAERRRFWRNDGVSVLGKAIWGILGVAEE